MPQGGATQARAMEFATVPVATGSATVGVPNSAVKASSSRLVQASSA